MKREKTRKEIEKSLIKAKKISDLSFAVLVVVVFAVCFYVIG